MVNPAEISTVPAPLDEPSSVELFRVLEEALNYAIAACHLDSSSEVRLSCEQYDKSILYIDEILSKLPSHTLQYSKLMQLRNNYDDRMELLKNNDSFKPEAIPSKTKNVANVDNKRLSPKGFEEDGRLPIFYDSVNEGSDRLFEEEPESLVQIPYWRMRFIQKSILSGAFLTPSVFVPACVWSQIGVKFCGLSIKTSAFQAVITITKEIDFVPEDFKKRISSSQSLLLLLSSLRNAHEEMITIQNQLSKPFLYIQEVNVDDSVKASSVKGQIALSRFTSIVATFGKTVINFAEVGYQRLGTMAARVSEDDFAAYTGLVSQTCETCQVFDKVRAYVVTEMQALMATMDPGSSTSSSVILAAVMLSTGFDECSASVESTTSGEDSNSEDEVAADICHKQAVDHPTEAAEVVIRPDAPIAPIPIRVTFSGVETDAKGGESDSHHRLILLQGLNEELEGISYFMRDVVCEILLRDTEVLTLRYLQKTRKSFSRMYWDEDSSPKDDSSGILDF